MTAPQSLDSIYRKRRKKSAPVVSPPPVQQTKKSRRPRRLVFRVVVGTLGTVTAYILLAPYLPGLAYSLPSSSEQIPTVSTFHSVPAEGRGEDAAKYPYYGKNILTIDKIGVQSEILEGVNEATLGRGLWRRPHSSTPELGGNTVIAAHRFKYTTGANTFYHLDKLKPGDNVSLTWKGLTYEYEIISASVVPSTDTSIEARTEDAILTLYTCTPLWTSDKRMVRRGKLVKINDRVI